MKMMRIDEAVQARLCHEPGTRMIDSQGRSRAYVPANTSGEGKQTMTSEYEIIRGDLVNILYDETKNRDNVAYIFDCGIKTLMQEERVVGGKVHVTFSNGEEGEYDIVIGADGVASKTRSLMLGLSFPDPCQDLGMHISFFTAPAMKGDTNDFMICHIPGGKIIMVRKDSPENLRVWLWSRVGCEKLGLPDTRLGIRVLHTIFWLTQALKIGTIIGFFSASEVQQKLEFKDYFGLRSQYAL